MGKHQKKANETPEETAARKAYQNAAKKLSRLKEKGVLPEGPGTLEAKRAQLMITETWKSAYAALRGESKTKLDAHIERWVGLTVMMHDAYTVLSTKDMTPEDVEYVLMVKAEADEFAKEFPPTKTALSGNSEPGRQD